MKKMVHTKSLQAATVWLLAKNFDSAPCLYSCIKAIQKGNCEEWLIQTMNRPEYKRAYPLSICGWTTRRKKIRDENKKTLLIRIQLANLPQSVLDKIIFTRGKITERICREFLNLHQVKNSWYDYETFLGEIIDNVLGRTPLPTTKHFEKEIAKYNEAISEVEFWLGKIDEESFRNSFLENLIAKNEKTKAVIANQGTIRFNKLHQKKEQALQVKLNALSAEEDAMKKKQQETEKQLKIKAITDQVMHGDAREMLHKAPNDFNLLLIDPPYGKNLNVGWKKTAVKSIANDESLEVAIKLLSDVLHIAYPKMNDDATVFVWCDRKCEAAFMDIIKEVGFSIKSRIIWKKSNH